MKKTNILLGLIILLFAVSAVMAQTTTTLPVICCSWNPTAEACEGYCTAGTECTQTGFQTCDCTPIGTTTTTTTTTTSTTTTTLSDCEAQCQSLQYLGGYCSTYPVIVNVTICQAGEVDIGPFGDCIPPAGQVGLGKSCCCITSTTSTTLVSVPEFTSAGAALIVLLTTPAFAYLLIRKR